MSVSIIPQPPVPASIYGFFPPPANYTRIWARCKWNNCYSRKFRGAVVMCQSAKSVRQSKTQQVVRGLQRNKNPPMAKPDQNRKILNQTSLPLTESLQVASACTICTNARKSASAMQMALRKQSTSLIQYFPATHSYASESRASSSTHVGAASGEGV